MKEKCKYWKYYGADEDGEFVSCDLEDTPETMVQCNGEIINCRNKEKLENAKD